MLIVTQSQILLDLEVVARPVVPLASNPVPVPLIATPVLGSQVSIDRQLEPQPPKQLSRDRPEVLLQAYLAEKAAWLAQHPTVRPTEYRKARKWKNLRPKVLKEQVFYMPRERRDLTGAIIADKANWTNKEIIVWLDNKDRKKEDEYNRLKSEFVRNGNRHTENRSKDIWARIEGEHAREAERYIL